MTRRTSFIGLESISTHVVGLAMFLCMVALLVEIAGCDKGNGTASKPTTSPSPVATTESSAPPATKLVTLADLPATKCVWTSKGGDPVDLRWPLPNELRFRLSDPGGALMGFEIVKYEKLAVDTGATSDADSQDAKAITSSNGKLEVTVDAHYAFGWDAQGKQVDQSTFALECRPAGSTDWKNLTSLSGEPRQVSVSPDGSQIAFVVGDTATIIGATGNTIDKIEPAVAALWGADGHSIYCLRRWDNTSAAVFRYDLQTKERQGLFSCDGLKCVAVSPDGSYLAYICEVADEDAAKEKKVLVEASSTQPSMIRAIANQAAADLPTNHQLCLYKLSTGKTFRASMKCSGAPTLAYAPDGRFLAFVNNDSIFRVSPDEIINAATK
jgi:hypothetical protein